MFLIVYVWGNKKRNDFSFFKIIFKNSCQGTQIFFSPLKILTAKNCTSETISCYEMKRIYECVLKIELYIYGYVILFTICWQKYNQTFF